MVIEPFIDMAVFFFVQLKLHSFQWFHIQNVVCIVQGRLFIIERRKSHPFEVTTVTLLSTHHNPHGPGRREGGGEREEERGGEREEEERGRRREGEGEREKERGRKRERGRRREGEGERVKERGRRETQASDHVQVTHW